MEATAQNTPDTQTPNTEAVTPAVVTTGANEYPNRPAALGGPANVREGATIQQAPDMDNPDNILLTDGRVAHVGTGTGKNIREARRIADGDNSMMQSALVCTCTTIGGRKLLIEDLDAMPMRDALAIESRFNEKNGL